MKTASPALINLLGKRQFYSADLYSFSLVGGGQRNYCGGDRDIVWNAMTWNAGGAAAPYFDCNDKTAKCHWKVEVEVDTLDFDVLLEGRPCSASRCYRRRGRECFTVRR